ncbi:MAG: hypothetical protein PHN69_03485 [Candidatus Pacebacteria bacterium]|nr:hypothetical protein [Candidatus Paceibacterota bacterium]
MPAVKIQTLPFNSTEELVEAVREKRRESGFKLRPPTCLWQLCKDRRLVLTPSERHEILSRLAHIATEAKQARVHSNRHVEENGTMLPLLFVATVEKTDSTDKGNTFVTLPTQPSKPQIIQENLFPGMTSGYQNRPYHWPRRR